MEIRNMVALTLMIPIVLLPAVFVWFLNITGLRALWKEDRAREARRV